MLDYFERLINPFPPEHPTEPPKGLYQFCRHYTRGIESYLLLMAILTICVAIGEAMLYGILGKIIDWLAEKDPQSFLEEEMLSLIGLSLFILLLMPILVLLHSLIMYQSLMGNFPMIVRWQAHRYLLNQSYAFFQNEFSGRIATKVMQTALAVRETVMKTLDVMLFISVYLITTLFLVVNADPHLCIPLLIWLAVYSTILYYFIPKLKQISELQADARSTMTGRIVDSYTNILTLKLFSHNQRESEYAKTSMENFLTTVHPQMRLVTKLLGCVWGSNMLLVFSVGALGIYLWINGNVSTGAIAIALSLAIRLTGMSHWIMWEISALFENIGIVHDSINTISEPQTVVDAPNAIPLKVKSGAIDFNHIGFVYNRIDQKQSEQVFNNLDLHIAAGEKVGIVGRSGAGKSTLISLLLRFYDVQQGNIQIDGQNIRQVTQDSLRANIGIVTQDTSLLHRSIRDNILFGKPDATEAQMLEAAKLAHAHEFIQALVDSNGRESYDAFVGERGVNLSGGQRQRIAIARVLLKNAPILILDEATSALDSGVEASIQQNLYQLMQGKTVIAIAHRLSTIAAMDRLIVLDKGRIVEQGRHAELLSHNQLYATLWNHQSGGFLGHLNE
ncbi:ABC transporter ATP-binding protein [Nitrosomonas sp. Nm132]|jgi:ATP-binding cassette subfamily B protein/ATP-binding cassette subfamily B multidrug efflux pump|uniref:ABC transporter ATP-binding protein n=1 Tax=Nitrosomonas sp. Nm132 TaxID=1881053 RepID=UPI000886A745|nr:ABC transporter ATP-binding protein [Nitrosomonas sp. Nm132]SDH70482.1 ATP-binding cassette, subfamily B/ATP-binding cassette, subfamily B, multidrug efflux pump [Nitrosomonas sp. Nm132]